MKLRSLGGSSSDGGEWLSISDMMTGLMVIFLFIAISYMMDVRADNQTMSKIAEAYFDTHEKLYVTLREEFKDDLPRWSAHLDSSSLAVRFTEPDVLFDAGSSRIKPAFRDILGDFFPRYIGILMSPEFIDDISEVRIEGHTSSEWLNYPLEEAYFSNMDLSQRRTRAVLQYVMAIMGHEPATVDWLRSMFTANGLSSSHLILREGIEDRIRSRRVEFRVRTNAEKRIVEIMRVGS